MGAATEGTGAFSAMNVGKCETVTREDGANAHAFVVEVVIPREGPETDAQTLANDDLRFFHGTHQGAARGENSPPRARLPRRRFPWTRWSSADLLARIGRRSRMWRGRNPPRRPGSRVWGGCVGAWTVFRIFNVYLYFAEPKPDDLAARRLFHQRVGRQLTFSARKNVTKLRRCVPSGSRGRHRRIRTARSPRLARTMPSDAAPPRRKEERAAKRAAKGSTGLSGKSGGACSCCARGTSCCGGGGSRERDAPNPSMRRRKRRPQ